MFTYPAQQSAVADADKKIEQRLRTNGRFFHLNGQNHFLKAVTYGPFPAEKTPDPTREFPRIAQAGFNTLRLYEEPSTRLLDLAQQHGLQVIYTPAWDYHHDFINEAHRLNQAEILLTQSLRQHAHHPALAAILIANEIPPDLVRFLGPDLVRQALESLITLGKQLAPHLLFGYANFPTTEYLEPANADFTAFNIYLEDRTAFQNYLRRLHNIAGDRPLLLTECGLDTQRHSEEEQAQLLTNTVADAHQLGCAGLTLYAWSDLWWNNQREITDWSFGLTRRDGTSKPALQALTTAFQTTNHHLPPPLNNPPKISVIICAYNGASRLTSTLTHATQIRYPNYEVLLIDDGSTDYTKKIVKQFPTVRYHYQSNQGLSVARNTGAYLATGSILAYTDDDCDPDPHWLTWLAPQFTDPQVGIVGGPNLPPPATSNSQVITSAAPGAPTHILLNDTTAEHVPGCNLVIRKSALLEIGGFTSLFRIAGDDVDFGWRLRDAGYTIAFSPPAFVWHHRRTTIRRYLKQQIGYGKAEALLHRLHPQRFDTHGINWHGCVYSGAPLRIEPGFTIYHGPQGNAPYQQLATHHLPTRPIPTSQDTPLNQGKLTLCRILQPLLRSLTRWYHGGPRPKLILPKLNLKKQPPPTETQAHWTSLDRHQLLEQLQQQGWTTSANEDWDLQKGTQKILTATEYYPNTHRLLLKLQSPTKDTWITIKKIILKNSVHPV